nr:MAG TPA: YopX protein [Caudoviricetes sp.]
MSGDIVRITKSKEIDIGKVIYEYNGFTVDVTNMDRFYGRVHLLEKFTEVIGNVFENGDILNDSKNTEKN